MTRIIAVVGTNASGKSSIGVELAKIFNGEIISADSRQLYKGFDLCCGKITPAETQGVPHHLLNIKNIGEPFSVFDFQKMVYELVPQILGRGKTPFIVGGTGQYVKAVVEGFPFSNRSPDMILREKLEKLSLCELQAMLTPEGRASFDSRPSDLQNKRRVIATLEKIAHCEPLESENTAIYNTLQLGITWQREELHRRIEERLERRIRDGMIDEVKLYLDNGGSEEYLDKLGLEYRYILRYLKGEFQTLDEFKLKMAQEIRHFAKKQTTWFKKDAKIHWIDMNMSPLEEARRLISAFLERP